MSRTAIAYLNYLRQQVYINSLTDEDKTNYVDNTYDITTDIQSIKNYLGIDSTMQQQVFESYSDLTDYYLIIDDSQFVKDQTTIEVTDIYFSDHLDETRYDNSVLLFTKNDIIYNYELQDSSTILHLKFKIKQYPDITDFQIYSFPVFLSPNVPWLANDLIVQYDINFVTINLFTEHSMLLTLKDYIEDNYVTQLNDNMRLSFVGWNNMTFVPYTEMLNDMIIQSLSKSLGKEWLDVRTDVIKQYFHDFETIYKITQQSDINDIIDMFESTILTFYSDHVDQTFDMYAGFTTDADLYDVVYDKTRMQWESGNLVDKLSINFIRFVLVRNNIYNQKFTLLHDGTEFWSDYIKFKVQNVIPNWTYTFDFTQTGFDFDITSVHNTDIPLKIDILEYSNNLVQASPTQYSRFVNQYYFTEFVLKFKANKLNIDYGLNSTRLFLSDSLSEEYKDIRYSFVYAPWDVISEKIAKIRFEPDYVGVENTWSVEKLLPLSEDYTSYYDLSARFDQDSTDQQMQIKIPIDYELIYSRDVAISVQLASLDATGGLLPQFNYLIQDGTVSSLIISPTLTVVNNEVKKTFVVMFRYKFDRNGIYTDDVIQRLNGVLRANIYTSNLDSTDVNYFNEYIDVHFITTRFKIRQSSTTPIQAQAYGEKEVVEFKPPFSSKASFNIYTKHEYKEDHTDEEGFCNFGIGASGGRDIEGEKLINRTITIKGIPITIDVNFDEGMSVTDTKISDASLMKKEADVVTQYTPVIGYIKQAENFMKDEIWKAITHKFHQQVITDLFNWYMSSIAYDMQITYRPDQSKSFLSTAQKSEFIDSLLTSDSTYNNWSLLKYVFNYYGYDHTSVNAYSNEDIKKIEPKFIEDSYMGVTTFTSYSLNQKYSTQFDIYFSRSEIYQLSNLLLFMKEAFVAKYYPEVLPSTWKYTKYGELGTLENNGYYTYGDMFRGAYFGGNIKLQDHSTDLYTFVTSTGLSGSLSPITDYFCENITIDYTTRSGSTLSLTVDEVTALYFSDEHDMTGAQDSIRRSLFSLITGALSGEIKVKRIYSADLTGMLDNITDDVFSVYLVPTELSPLYSHFKITDIKYVFDNNVATITELFNRADLMSGIFKTNEILGTGLKLQCKYLNRSLSEVPLSMMIFYKDEFGYEKTLSVELKLRSKLQTFIVSATSQVLKYGANIFKALWLLHVFNQDADVINNTKDALNNAVGNVMAGDDMGAADSAKQFQGGFFTIKKQYYNTYQKYLNTDVLDAFYFSYLENIMYGKEAFNFSSSVSLFAVPENIENLDQNDGKFKYAEDAVTYLTDSTYRANEAQYEDSEEFGNDYNALIDYRRIIDIYYDMYLDRLGYDVNLILLPDTTYKVSFKTYLIYEQTLSAGENAMGTLVSFLSAVGGGDPYLCMVYLKEFLTMAKIYPNFEDLMKGILRNLQIPENFERYGRAPSPMYPISIDGYYPNQYEQDYNSFIESSTAQYMEFEKSNKAHFAFAVPFERIFMSIDTTSTGIFDVNFIEFAQTYLKTQFSFSFEEMTGSNPTVNKQKDKITVSVKTPSVIPKKYIDVIVRPLF